MKKLLITTAIIALAAPALASGIGGDSINGNSGIANNGTIQNSTLNNGLGAGGTVNTGSTNVNANSSHSSAKQGQVQGQSATSGVQGSGNSSVTIKDRKQAPAVFAPGLVAGFDCLGSASIGGSVAGFGIGGGSTTANDDCINVYLARELERKGSKAGAWGVLCESPKVRKHAPECADYREEYALDSVGDSEFPEVSHASPAKH